MTLETLEKLYQVVRSRIGGFITAEQRKEACDALDKIHVVAYDAQKLRRAAQRYLDVPTDDNKFVLQNMIEEQAQ